MALFLAKKQEKCPFWAFSGINRGQRLFYEGKFIFAALNQGKLVNWLIGGDFLAIYRDGVAFEELAAFALAAREAGLDENIEEIGAFRGGREALGEQFNFVGAKVANLAIAKENGGDFLGGFSSGGAVDEFGNLVGEQALAVASGWVFGVLGENFAEFFWGDDGVVLEVFFERIVGLIEPELIEVEDAGLVAVEPDGVAFGFAEFTTGDFINNKRATVSVSLGVFETADEVNTRGAVAVLIGAAELKIDVVFAEKMEEVIALDEGVAKLGIADAGATFADAGLDELAIEKLSHAKGLADFAKEWQEFDFTEPIEVVENLGVGRGMSDADDLFRESDLVFGDFVETLQIALDGIFWIADLAGGATNEIIRSIAVANEAGAHHKSSEVADMKRIGARVGAPIKITRSFV